MPKTTAKIIEDTASSIVAGKNSKMSVKTGRLLTREVPRSPRSEYRFVEAQLMPHGIYSRRRRVAPKNGSYRIGGDDSGDDENYDEHSEDDQNHKRKSFDNEAAKFHRNPVVLI